jgi:hypothetical protein
MTNKMIAFCGLDCAACPAYLAAERLSMDERQKIADQWVKEFNAQVSAADIDCVGCMVKDGTHIGHCSECAIRLCGLERGLANCAVCSDYGCDKLEGFLKNVPHARTNLEALRNG